MPTSLYDGQQQMLPSYPQRHGKTDMVNSEQVSQCIEVLCQCGCDAVRATISAMESGAVVPQVNILSEDERRMVLQELKAVMAVYDTRK